MFYNNQQSLIINMINKNESFLTWQSLQKSYLNFLETRFWFWVVLTKIRKKYYYYILLLCYLTIHKMMMLLHHFFVSFTGCNIRFIGRYLLKVFCLCVIQIEPVCHWIQGKKKSYSLFWLVSFRTIRWGYTYKESQKWSEGIPEKKDVAYNIRLFLIK